MELSMIAAGTIVGLVVGLTGIGGGALMTPALVMIFGVAPQTAVGTDLWFAFFTKIIGVGVHGYAGTIDWQIVRRLSLGSLPAAVAALAYLSWLGTSKSHDGMIMTVLGVALMITAAGMFARESLHHLGRNLRISQPRSFKRFQPAGTVFAGAIVGAMVSMTSVGAGALGTVALAYLYPLRLTPAKLVGTDLAHAIPLALVAGFGHYYLGSVDFNALGNLLMGSVPGVLVGSTLALRAADKFVRNAIGFLLVLVACRILF